MKYELTIIPHLPGSAVETHNVSSKLPIAEAFVNAYNEYSVDPDLKHRERWFIPLDAIYRAEYDATVREDFVSMEDYGAYWELKPKH